MARHSMRESRSLTLARFIHALLLDIRFQRRRIVYYMTMASEMTNPNVMVVVLAPDQRHANFNYAFGETHIGVGVILTIATVVFMSVYPTISGCAMMSWFCDDLSAPNGKYHKRMARFATVWDIYGELCNCLGNIWPAWQLFGICMRA